jgi:hypothetical protein
MPPGECVLFSSLTGQLTCQPGMALPCSPHCAHSGDEQDPLRMRQIVAHDASRARLHPILIRVGAAAHYFIQASYA